MTRDKDNISSTILQISLRTLINVILVFMLVEGFVMTYHFSYKLFADFSYAPSSKQTVNITIASGDTARDVAVVLEQNRVVESRYLFFARVYLGKYNSRIKVGTYTVGPAMTPDEICKLICGLQSEGSA